jgi:regulator of protease activity HflC (stomatin/prohibitin superfamily)
LILIGLICLPQLVDTVEKGTYQVKQAAITGEMDAKMTPGLWGQYFGDIDVWPKAETFFFTADNDTEGDVDADTSMEVRFNDGSMCKISGTLRIIMPTTKDDAISLVVDRNHKTYYDLQEKLIKPTVRNVLRSTANLMSARESYSEKRLDYVTWAKDQIENGVYQTKEEVKKIKDLVTGEETYKKVKVIKKDDEGNYLYQSNPMEGTGIVLKNFEIKTFVYEKKVREQIAKQQEARMAVETAKAKAEEAKQEELKAVAEGKMKVARAKYEKEQDKIRAVVEAQKEKEVQELNAARDKNVKIIEGEKLKEFAKLEKEAAAELKEKNILEGQGLAEKRKLVLKADGALKQKLATLENINRVWADAYRERKVPAYYMAAGASSEGNGGGGSLDLETKQFQQMINIMTAQALGLDLSIKKAEDVQ